MNQHMNLNLLIGPHWKEVDGLNLEAFKQKVWIQRGYEIFNRENKYLAKCKVGKIRCLSEADSKEKDRSG